MGDGDTKAASLGELFVELVNTVKELRERCPWDRQQTLTSLSRYLVEEAYEAAHAARVNPKEELADELGDVLVQVLFHALVGRENGFFTLEEVLIKAREKLIRRHPHVYGKSSASTAEEVLRQWQEIKREERKNAGIESSLGDGARVMPGVLRAEKLGERARSAGMDWRDALEVIKKVREELDEAEKAILQGHKTDAIGELGDALLALANVPRFLGASAEQTLQDACDKFVERFQAVERLAKARNVKLTELDQEEIEKLWQEAKILCIGTETKKPK